MTTCLLRPKPDFCQTHQHRTDHLTPNSGQMQTLPDPTMGSTTACFAFSATRVATVRYQFYVFFAPYERRSRTVKPDGQRLLY
jgi:hypothetical protein